MAYPLGTDAIGRDILSRLIHGARLSLLIGIAVVTLSGWSPGRFSVWSRVFSAA